MPKLYQLADDKAAYGFNAGKWIIVSDDSENEFSRPMSHERAAAFLARLESIMAKPERAAAILQAADSLLSDIESMQRRTGSELFGGFDVWEIDGESAVVEWPNLAISADGLRAAMESES